jgi:NADH-quinone oxidoreductase subunit L
MPFSEISSWLVWILPLLSSVFVPLIARFSEKARNYFVITITAVTTFLAFTLIPAVSSGQSVNYFTSWIPAIAGLPGTAAGVFIDPLSVLFACLVGFFGLIIAIYSQGYMKGENGLTRYYFFFLLFIGSMIGLVISDNFLQMFIFWEMVGLCSYSLISFWYHRPESIRSGTKVFMMTRIGDIMLLSAIGILYATLHTFSFHETILAIQAGAISSETLVLVAFLVLGGAISKSAQLPLHTWLYSAMEAPTSVSALLHAATMVKAGIFLIARFILIAAPMMAALQPLWFPTVAWIGVLTALIGATMALYTSDIKGVLAYSTVSQLGFMMAALGTSGASGASSLGWFASLFHMVSHAFFEGLGFLLAGGIIHAIGTRDMRLMGGLRKAMPLTFAMAIIMVLTTSGLPPFAAFFSKGLVIESIMEAGNLLQVIIIFATTAITFAYSLRFLKLIFLGKESEHLEKIHVHEAPKIMLIPAAVLAIMCIVWGLIEPMLGSFLGVEGEVSLIGAFFNLETAVFALLLIPAGLLVYLTYFKHSAIMAKIRSPANPLTVLFKNGYFFDDFYEKVVTKAILLFSSALHVFENSVFGRLPAAVAQSTMRGASKLRKLPTDTLQNYVSAALIGFLIIVILIIITIGV